MIVFLPPESRTIGSSHTPEPAKSPSEKAILDLYLSTFPTMRAGKLRAILTKLQGFSGDYMRRHQYAERMFNVVGVRVDYDKTPIRLYNGGPHDSWYEIGQVPKALADYVTWLQTQG